MATLLVPPLDEEPWPTLGDQVADWIEAYCSYGPGERLGDPYEVTGDFRAQLQRTYEVFPKGHRLEGRRRFKRAYLEERKGTAKTERAMMVAFAESHPSAPVRCDGFDAAGQPVGVGVQSPYIPLVSYTVEQTEDLGYNVLRSVIEASELGSDYDVGLERIVLLDGRGREAGKIVALAGSPNARDGARTTWQHFDEPHRMTLDRLIKAHTTMVENTYKRVGADAWTLYTSTAGDLAEVSVARDLREYAEQVDRGELDDPRLFFFSRFAPIDMPMETPDDVRAYLLEASGPNASWSGDIDGLVSRWFEPKTDRPYYRRVWGNQWWSGAGRAVDAEVWDRNYRDASIADGALVTLGFDGSLTGDHTGIVATDVESGLQVVIGHWAPTDDEPIDRRLVDAAMAAAIDRYDVWRAYCDPYRWEDDIARWSGRWPKQVVSWSTARDEQMGEAIRCYRAAVAEGEATHDGDSTFRQHALNAFLEKTKKTDADGQPLYLVRKERRWSPNKIDLYVCGTLSWEARRDALAAGVKPRRARTYSF